MLVLAVENGNTCASLSEPPARSAAPPCVRVGPGITAHFSGDAGRITAMDWLGHAVP